MMSMTKYVEIVQTNEKCGTGERSEHKQSLFIFGCGLKIDGYSDMWSTKTRLSFQMTKTRLKTERNLIQKTVTKREFAIKMSAG